jgi:hypothetical protein
MKVGLHLKCNKYLDKNDPIDSAILELVKENTLRVNFVDINKGNRKYLKEYSTIIFPAKGSHTS